MPIVPVFPPAGGGSTPTPPTPGIPQWLDMPSKVYLITSTPSPDPSEYEWDEPTNGTGPFTYEATQMSGMPNTNNWTDYDLVNRKIIASQSTVLWGNDINQPSVFRVRAYDSVGNYGDCHVLIASPSVSNRVVLDEVVLEEDDPAVEFTWPPFAAGYVGMNSDTSPWSHALGSGDVWPSLMKNTTTARYQGPFTVNPAPGSVIFMNTLQKPASSTIPAALLIKAFRRKRGPLLTSTGGPYQVVIDHNMEDIGTQVGPITFPPGNVSTNADYGWSQPGIGTDSAQFRSTNLTAGVLTVDEVTLDSNGFRGRFECSATTNKRHDVLYMPRLLTSHNTPYSATPAFMGIRAAMVHMSDEVVVRFQGQVSRTGTSSNVTWYVGAINDSGVRVFFNQGAAIRGTPATDVAQITISNGTGGRIIGSTAPSAIYNVPIGVDIHLGVRPTAVIYLWPGDFPDLLEANPYGNVKHWVAEGDAKNGSYSNSSYAGASDTTFRSTGFAFGYLEYPIIGMQLALGNNGAASVDSILKRVVIAHRAGRQIRPMP